MDKKIQKYIDERGAVNLALKTARFLATENMEDEDYKTFVEVEIQARAELARLKRIEVIAKDVNDWLKRNGLGGTAHQRGLEAALVTGE